MASAAAQGSDAAGPGAWPAVLFTPDFQDKVASARVLAVGAGGIGCELLKTLVLSGFRAIECIDLDTIETSNLNRQFLFRRAHVGQSKARVAADVVRGFAPAADIQAHQANVKEARFDVDFFRAFDLVLNGLDNMDARRHVNRMCIAAGVPLVESGTAGYVGQVSVHLKGRTECYECRPRSNARQKSYPICTLRNTPDKPVHCVVWAKELLFPRLFGKVDVSDLDEAATAPTATAALEPAPAPAANSDAQAAAAATARAAAEEAAEAASFFKLGEGEAPLVYAARVFERLFAADISRVISMEELWKTRPPPHPLALAELLPGAAASADLAPAVAAAAPSASRALGLAGQALWGLADNARVFLASTAKFLTQRAGELGAAVFDKDDDLAVDFVTSASNLRAACYDIPQQSAFEAKGMAGNIIHAIATTNAIVAGLIVTEALKILAGCEGACVNSFLRTQPSTVGSRKTGRMLGLITGEVPAPPRAECMACGRAILHLVVNTRAMTLQALVDQVIKRQLAVNEPTLRTIGGFEYEEGEGVEDEEMNRRHLPKLLAALPGGGLVHGSVLEVGDQSQALSLELIISHQDAIDLQTHPEGFILQGEVPQAKPEAPAADAAAAAQGAPPPSPHAGKKRSRGGEGHEQQQPALAAGSDEQQQQQQQAKRQRAAANGAATANGSIAAAAAAAGANGRSKAAAAGKVEGEAGPGATAGDPVDLVSSDDECVLLSD